MRMLIVVSLIAAGFGLALVGGEPAYARTRTPTATPTPSATFAPPPDLMPRPGYTPMPVQTPAFEPTWPSPDQWGELAPGGTVYTGFSEPICLPSGVGDFRAWIGLSDPGGLFAAIYHIRTDSTLFLHQGEDGVSLVESSRNIRQAEANTVFDQVIAGIGKTAPCIVISMGNVGMGESQHSGTALWREMSLVLAAIGLGGIAAGAALRKRA